MTEVREDLEAFTAELFDGFFRADQRRWGQAYVRGLLLDGRRKSVEPMAARLGEDGNRQALAHFITSSPWNAAHVRARLAWRMYEAIGPEALIVDDTGFLKDGNASACVSRQYTGTAGKVTNCQVGVSLHLANDRASAAIDWRLFLPASWDPASPETDAAKVARRQRCGVPADAGHVEKWQLALDMIDEARSWGVDVPLVVADAGYGDATAFRLALEERKLAYAVGVSSGSLLTLNMRSRLPRLTQGIGRPPVATYPDKPMTVKELVIEAGRQAARPVSWREGSRPGKGRSGFKRMYSRFVVLRIRPAGREIRQATKGAGLPERWLLAEWPATEPEPVQFWLSSLPSGMPLASLVRLAKLRWRIEHDYREMKQALGLAHFEGRTWNGWHHHVTLVSAAHAFCTLQRLAHDPKDAAQD
ncbi:IS701 family transposase [Streptomyces nodosus]|uniref:IS701 family transposase n=1 Tax=Streptomyces nodosus TaxID=40318 RepID=UPI0009A12AD1|nr:IS701 family transposase [Streptomyces nodosus]